MASKLVVNAIPQETRVALMENDRLTELYIERPNERGIVGNIYKGKVVRVLPGMEAAFVDIGLERAAFLYVTDFFEEYKDAFRPEEVEAEKRRKRRPKKSIQDVVKEGQDILVQVAKDPISTKGARVTSHVSLPGRHLVYMPTVDHVGVSRKIESEEERKRLRDLVMSHRAGGGFIVRTASAGQPNEKLETDIKYLHQLWHRILGRHRGMKAPSIIHQDLGLVQRTVRDSFTDDVGKLVVDNRSVYREVRQFVGQFLPKRKNHVELFKGPDPIFDHYKVTNQLERALSKRVWLKSGGYLIIEQTEALTTIDVNTGRFVGSKNLEETIIKTNLEAVEEIVAQLRLRNIGGLIILDMIDMDRKSSRNKVYRALEQAFANDKAKTNVLQISELGLVEMTRKRTRENLVQRLCETCANCSGKGFHRSRRTVAYEILRQLHVEIDFKASHKNIEVAAHPNVTEVLQMEVFDTLTELENRSGRRIVVRPQSGFNPENYQIRLTGHTLPRSPKPLARPTLPVAVSRERGTESEE